MNLEQITVGEFHQRCKAQGVSGRMHVALKCPVCGTVQSLTSLDRAGVPAGKQEHYIGFSCVGRFTNAGPWKKDEPPGRGCDWTLGGLFRIHKLEVITADGEKHPTFEIATAEEAQALERLHEATRAPG